MLVLRLPVISVKYVKSMDGEIAQEEIELDSSGGKSHLSLRITDSSMFNKFLPGQVMLVTVNPDEV